MKCKKLLTLKKTKCKLIYTSNVYFENRKKNWYTRDQIQGIEKSIVHCFVLSFCTKPR